MGSRLQCFVCGCVVLLVFAVTSSEQQGAPVLVTTGRDENTVSFTCRVSGQFSAVFLLNGTVEENIQFGQETIEIEITPRSEGFFSCGLYDPSTLMILESNRLGPYAANPRFTVHENVRLFYVGFIGSQVTLLPLIPLGVLEARYAYTWLNNINEELDGPRHTLSTVDKALSITSLRPSDAGRYALRVLVSDTTAQYTYANSSYRLYVQEMPQVISLTADTVRTKGEKQIIHENFTCAAQGYPNISILWLHNGKRVANTPGKYQIASTNTSLTTLTSTLTLRDLNSTDNGVLTCIASIEGCNVDQSRMFCHSQPFNASINTTISILTREFQYEVIILRGQNIELRITFEGSPLPATFQVYILYLEDSEDDVRPVISPGMYTNVPDILTAYIPNSITPSFTNFRIRIALGTDSAHIGPYVPPTKDIVYDINSPDNGCENWQGPAIIAAVVGAILITVLVVMLLLIYQRRSLNQKRNTKRQELRIPASEITLHNFIDPDATHEKRMEQYQTMFPRCYHTLADGEDESEMSEDNIKREQSSRVVADGTVIEPRIISEWLRTTDEVLCLIRNKQKKDELMHHIMATITREKSAPNGQQFSSK